MVSATFRFYGELNDFLARERRGRSFATPCARAATTKHMIEALGVPHTEVELVLLNGEPRGLDDILEEGDRIAVYPRFTSFDVADVARLDQRPPGRARFVADAHLGGLARLLRMAGFDTIYRNTLNDAEVEAIALDDGRAVLTRDRELLKRRGIAHGCYVRALKAEEQLREVVERFGLAERMRPFTLCLSCNAPLRSIAKEEVLDRLPPRVAATQDEFSTCDCCHGVFWKGSHWQRMAGVLNEIH
ncbi:Mut7-C ubiquitin/RNAse domain-containing protein [Telluria mixta]|uniref:Mut7-C ubiquitin/RNAse domain-containing protein n=1 Tax=Telluria mixta TaxID=34071 RepID=A0ABT2C3T5_9BURK|nr:Mut7-C ubiquitin/RNAse domain-containing protein [Telluria mixta]MCS0632055.1 Mut7-C ubiquitin/RNAse domain-containing protein [Telluria mixta]WEM95268.1 Mut7-C ubiquitin/RNAse domain-containing protein [Telluria mixta]